MDFWIILYIIDGLLFLLVSVTTLYLLIFAIASMFPQRELQSETNTRNRFVVIISAYKADDTIVSTVKSVLSQSYPDHLFDVVVVSKDMNEVTNFQLEQLPITRIDANYAVSTKVKALQAAVKGLPAFKIYDIIVVLDADNKVAEDFLERMNNAYEMSSTKCIQAHRISQNRNTVSARWDSVFEEINNSIFRRGHVMLGFSSSICGSGTAYDFSWFHENIFKVSDDGDEKELEALLMRQGIFIDYFDTICVFDRKTQKTSDFTRQRKRWIARQYRSLMANIHFLFPAIFNKNYDYADKIFQWLLLPRTIMVPVILLMSVILPLIYFSLALKWWILFAIITFVFAISTPDYLVDSNFRKDFPLIPLYLLLSIWYRLHTKWNNFIYNKFGPKNKPAQ